MPEKNENTEKKKRFRRTKTSLEKDVNNAISSLIEEVGFANVTLTGIAQRAHIEPAVFYRRYANMDELFDQFTKKYDYWLTNIAETIPAEYNKEETFKLILKNLSNALSKNKAMQQLLIWELSADNEITRRTTELRESTNEPLVQQIETIFQDSDIDANAITAVLIAGIYYLLIYQGRSSFCGINFGKRNGKIRLDAAVEQISTFMFDALKQRQDKNQLAEKLRAEGVSEEIIHKCVFA